MCIITYGKIKLLLLSLSLVVNMHSYLLLTMIQLFYILAVLEFESRIYGTILPATYTILTRTDSTNKMCAIYKPKSLF